MDRFPETEEDEYLRWKREFLASSRGRLASLLDNLSPAEAVAVIRAFSYFSLLANIAEDRHHVRRQRGSRRDGRAPLPSTLATTQHELGEARARKLSSLFHDGRTRLAVGGAGVGGSSAEASRASRCIAASTDASSAR